MESNLLNLTGNTKEIKMKTQSLFSDTAIMQLKQYFDLFVEAFGYEPEAVQMGAFHRMQDEVKQNELDYLRNRIAERKIREEQFEQTMESGDKSWMNI